MLDLSETQLYLLRKNHKDIVWLFDVTDKNDKSFHWSTRDYVYNSTEYSFNVTNFSGISLSRSKSEENIIAPSEVEIEIGNVGNTYSAENFVDGSVLISLLIDDTLIAKWKFNIIESYGGYQTITLKCEDFLQKYLEGAYPNTQYVKALFPDVYYEDEDLCVPVCFGTAYIPLRPVEIEGDRYYLLGPTDRTYTIEEVHAPSEWGIKQTWSSADYSFNQYTKTDQFGNSWRVFQPIIADSDLDGTADACGVWISGQKILDMPTKFSYNSTTNPADVIKTILKDFGVPDSEIDDDSFSSAASTFNSWGLEWNGGFWTKSDRRFILATLLNMCHSRILVRDKLVLSVLSNKVQKNITSAVVSKESFDYTKLTEELSDSGYVAWQKEGEPQDNMLKALVPGKDTTTNYISNETIFIPWVQDAIHVQKLACLAFQRKFFKVAQVSFKGRSELLVLEPGDIVRVIGSNYGGMYNVIVDNVKINPDLVIEISATRHSIDFDDWNSLTQFSYITIYTTVPSAWEALPSGYGYGIRWDRDQATLLVEGTIRVTGGFIADAGGFIRSGQTGFNQGTGFWIGNDAGTPKLSIGCSTGKRITWDGTTLTIKGDLKFDDNNYWEVGGDFRVGAAEHYILWDLSNAELTIKGKLTFDNYNYWYPGGDFRVGSADKYMYWNGSSLEIRGDSNNYWEPGGNFSVGSSSQFLTWDGSTLYIKGKGHFGDDNDYTLLGDPDYGGRIYFYQSGYQRGFIYGDANGLHLSTPYQIRLDEDTRVAGTLYTCALEPLTDTDYNIGSSSKRYQEGWIHLMRSYRVNPESDQTGSVGQSTSAWHDIYYCVLNDVCSLGMVEEIANPLELIKNIKVNKDKYTPKELPKADYKTLPKFIKTIKYDDIWKDEENFKEHLQSILSRNAEVVYEDDEKVTVKVEALDITATVSLLLGAIRQLINQIGVNK